jgi:hypothetical protein
LPGAQVAVDLLRHDRSVGEQEGRAEADAGLIRHLRPGLRRGQRGEREEGSEREAQNALVEKGGGDAGH